MILVSFQVAIALTLVPAAEQANKLFDLWMVLLTAVVFGAMELLCFKLLWMGLGNLSRASRMVGANAPSA
jgi:heme/copper-type cytochrome/quinol oxidase subunit 4